MPDVTVKSLLGETTTKHIPDHDFFVSLEEERLKPALVTTLELENSGKTANVTDQCGRTQRTKQSNSGWMLRVEGIITGEDRVGNLSLSRLKTIAKMDTVDVNCPLFDGTIVVSNVLIRMVSDINEIDIHSGASQTEGRETAYEFTMQLGEEDSQDN